MFSSKCLKLVTSRSLSSLTRLQAYIPPSWAKELKDIPSHYVKLCCRNTPIHDWHPPGLPSTFQLSIKRDDLTGNSLSGNKVRKLEFLMADALDKECDTVLTCGGVQSNHCRAVAVAARELGLDSYLFLRHKEQNTEIGCHGNLLLNHLVNAKIYLVPNESYETGLKPRMISVAKQLRHKGHKSYIIPLGGSNHIGLFGYISAFEELVQQNVLEDFDDIVLCIGSSGTAAGVAIGNYLTGSKVKCHAICACDNAKYFYDCINKELNSVGLDVKAEDLIDIIDDYKGLGYAISTTEELDFLYRISSTTGIMLDPVYTIKSVRGMLNEMQVNPSRFKGRRVLYIHTGGMFGLYDGRMNKLLQDKTTNNIIVWKDSIDSLPILD